MADAEVTRQASGSNDLGHDRRPIAIADLPWSRLAVGLDQLIPRGQDRHRRPRHHLDRGMAHRGKHADFLGPQKRAPGNNDIAVPHFLATPHYMAARFNIGIVNMDAVFFQQARAFDLDDGFRPRRNWRSRHDSRRLPQPELPRRRHARCDFLDNRQRTAAAVQIGHAHRVAVHHRFVVRRHVQVTDSILGQHQSMRVGRRNRGRRKGANMLKDRSLCGGDGHHGRDSSTGGR